MPLCLKFGHQKQPLNMVFYDDKKRKHLACAFCFSEHSANHHGAIMVPFTKEMDIAKQNLAKNRSRRAEVEK